MQGSRRFAALDGLRGVAAVVVLVYHVADFWPNDHFLSTAYLAVDLFFMLSGFVIAHAYDGRLRAGWSVYAFLVARIVRFYPLYILGCALGLAAAVAEAVANGQWWSLRGLAVTWGWAMAMLPQPDWQWDRSFSLNPPAWSLFYELLINLVYAALLPWLTVRRLWGIVLAFGITLAALSCFYGTVNFDGGPWHPLVTFVRPGFGFLAGVLIHRYWRAGTLPRLPIPATAALPLFLVALPLPLFAGAPGLVSALVVVAVFPLIVAIGASGTRPMDQNPPAAMLGESSYAIYAIHWPIMIILTDAARVVDETLTFAASIVAVVVVPPIGWLATRYFDAPLQRLSNPRPQVAPMQAQPILLLVDQRRERRRHNGS